MKDKILQLVIEKFTNRLNPNSRGGAAGKKNKYILILKITHEESLSLA